jgi:hypothetical protein
VKQGNLRDRQRERAVADVTKVVAVLPRAHDAYVCVRGIREPQMTDLVGHGVRQQARDILTAVARDTRDSIAEEHRIIGRGTSSARACPPHSVSAAVNAALTSRFAMTSPAVECWNARRMGEDRQKHWKSRGIGPPGRVGWA